MTAGGRRWLRTVAVLVVLAVVAAVVFVLVTPGGPTKALTADFVEAPGLYVGNNVEVLGIPVGKVTSIRAEPGMVVVKMSVRANLPVPSDAGAEIMAPQVVSDRFVQLLPAYTTGPTLPAGATIPMSRTVIPVSIDGVIGSLNELAAQLGPNGANRNGALTTVLSNLATQFDGTGPEFHAVVVNLSEALHGVAQDSPQVTSLLNNLGSLSQALANNSGTYDSFAANLTAVSGILASERSDIGSALSNLQQLLGNLTTFIDTNGASLGGSIRNLTVVATTLAQEQQALKQIFDVSPLALQNVNAAIDPQAPGGPALRARFDPLPDTKQLFAQICGTPALRFLVVLAAGTQTNPLTPASPIDTNCSVGNALNALTPPPGSTAGPNLTLKALAGS
jgi:phospholipid/cholesterol/gamma-HCH transport system substrate-binding protein